MAMRAYCAADQHLGSKQGHWALSGAPWNRRCRATGGGQMLQNPNSPEMHVGWNWQPLPVARFDDLASSLNRSTLELSELIETNPKRTQFRFVGRPITAPGCVDNPRRSQSVISGETPGITVLFVVK